MYCAGIDAGSRAIKAVIMNARSREVVAEGVVDQGIRQASLARELYERLLEQGRVAAGDVGRIIATGYGRNAVDFAHGTITEITCHAVGVRHTAPDAMTIVDIGGQDSKIIHLAGDGSLRDFAMNDRCAAGTGRFLEVVADRLDVELGSLGDMASKAADPVHISSMCVLFAETEIIGLLASDFTPENIAAGVQASIASRIGAMAGSNVKDPVVFTGGVALVSGMAEALSNVLGRPVRLASDPQMTGALGAALLAASEP
jgi:predicted CoA-substrate-specific enzyme activase